MPAAYSVTIFLGAVLLALVAKKRPTWSEQYAAALAAGGIAGESLMGVVIAVLVVIGIL